MVDPLSLSPDCSQGATPGRAGRAVLALGVIDPGPTRPPVSMRTTFRKPQGRAAARSCPRLARGLRQPAGLVEHVDAAPRVRQGSLRRVHGLTRKAGTSLGPLD
ncbi:unnamed protein product [Rangifer tarandus platyrhynchus]|uniref:Uncharacterized protein n=1 Tax=Rangifer tarandus platyrhynchus TaxID=3082113 RepID=A0ABN8Z452_RANTA|nr:unnamed protein product [Rangifer tarandus platyrhynchus]